MKKVLSLVLVLMMLITVFPMSASALTVKEAVNTIKLDPMREAWVFMGDDTLIKHVDSVIKGKTTNYDKLSAVYNDVINDAG